MIAPASNTLLALLSAVTWGAGDFSGGMAVRNGGGLLSAAIRVLLLGHALSLLALLALALALHDPLPHGAALAWGLGAGPIGALAILAFYLCLAQGAMGTSAALSGLLAAAIPSLASAGLEGAPGLLRLVGFAVAALAIWLIAASPAKNTTRTPARLLLLAILAGAGFGLYFIAFRMAATAGLLWPMVLCRLGSLATLLLLALVVRTGSPFTLPKSSLRWVPVAAFFDTAGSLAFMGATRAGRLDVASVLASLYPASTILLAAWLLQERPARRQAVGMLFALAAVVLVTL